jgi:chaperonin GroEL
MFISPKRDEARVKDRVEEAKTKLTGEGDHFLEKQIQKRIADLTAKVALLHVGAATETELKERKDRVDDALRATAAAVQKGYLVGGGTSLARISSSLDQSSPLIDHIFIKALQQPLLTIADNAGEPSEVILSKVLESKDAQWGFNAKTLLFGNLLSEGVIDPALVVEQAVVNAVSAANMIILSSTSLTNKDRTPPYNPGNLEDYAG